MPSEADRQRKQKELDSILDAALDELDDDSASDCDIDNNVMVGSHDAAACADVNGDDDYGSGINTNDNAAPTALGVPYSLEYLSNDKHKVAIAASRSNSPSRGRPQFGPEPPPDDDCGVIPPPLNPGDAELAASLEGMMKQFTDGLAAGGDGDGALDDMFKKMMLGEAAVGGGPVPPAYPTAMTPDQSQQEPTNNNGSGNESKSSTPSKSKINNNGPNKNNKKEEPNNVDESINRLLDGINQAASSQPNNTNNMPSQHHPGMMPDNNEIDPAQFEKLSEEMMSSIMGQFEKMGNANDSNDVVDGVMKQLLDKDLMYEPMKEVCTRFPKWLAENKDDLSEEEYTKYGKQYQYFQRIVHTYETDPTNFERLMELMQDIQEYGQPPVDIIKDLAPELEFDEEGMPIMDPTNGVGGMGSMMPGGMPFPPFPGAAGGPGNEQCCIS